MKIAIKEKYRGWTKRNLLNLLGVGFPIISLIVLASVTSNPLKNQIVAVMARVSPDANIRRAERATRGGCDGADCVAGTVIKNAATSGINSNAKPSAQTAAEQAIIDKYVSAAANGDQNALKTLKDNNTDLYNVAVGVGTKAALPPQPQRGLVTGGLSSTLDQKALKQVPAAAAPAQPGLTGITSLERQKISATQPTTSLPAGATTQTFTNLEKTDEGFITHTTTIVRDSTGKIIPNATKTVDTTAKTTSRFEQTTQGLIRYDTTVTSNVDTGKVTSTVTAPTIVQTAAEQAAANTAAQKLSQQTTQGNSKQPASTVPESLGTSLLNRTLSIAQNFVENSLVKTLTNISPIFSALLGVKPPTSPPSAQGSTTTPTQNQPQSGFGPLLNPVAPSQQNTAAQIPSKNITPSLNTPISNQPAGLTVLGSGQGPCLGLGHCDGTRMSQLFNFYASQTGAWYLADGPLTPAKFIALIDLGESLGSGNPAVAGGNPNTSTAKLTTDAIALAISNHIGSGAALRGTEYCSTADCQGGAGALNFVGAYSQSAWERYDYMLDYLKTGSTTTRNGLIDTQLRDYFLNNNITLDQVASKITVNKPSDPLNSPTDWGCRGCADQTINKMMKNADKYNIPIGKINTTNYNDIYYLGKDGEVVYTRNQAAYWSACGGRCVPYKP